MMSKAERIRTLYASLPDTPNRTRIVADVIGCGTSYVRTCVRQRIDGGLAKADIAYFIRHFGSVQAGVKARNDATAEYRRAYYKRRLREDPVWRAKRNAASAERRRLKRAAA